MQTRHLLWFRCFSSTRSKVRSGRGQFALFNCKYFPRSKRVSSVKSPRDEIVLYWESNLMGKAMFTVSGETVWNDSWLWLCSGINTLNTTIDGTACEFISGIYLLWQQLFWLQFQQYNKGVALKYNEIYHAHSLKPQKVSVYPNLKLLGFLI